MQRFFGACAFALLLFPFAAAVADEPGQRQITELEGVFHSHGGHSHDRDVFGYYNRKEVAAKAQSATFDAVGRIHVHDCGHGRLEICLTSHGQVIELSCNRIDLLFIAKTLDGQLVRVKGSLTIHPCGHSHFDLYHNLDHIDPCLALDRYSIKLRGDVVQERGEEYLHIRNLCIPLCDMRNRK